MVSSAMWILWLWLASLGVNAQTLDEVVQSRVQEVTPARVEASSNIAAVTGYVPIQNVEYRYGKDLFEDGTEEHALRFEIKSLTEIVNTSESQRLTQSLRSKEAQADLNQKLYQAYRQVAQELFQTQLVSLLGRRQAELKSVVAHGNVAMSLEKADSDDLVSSIRQLHRVEEDLGFHQVQELLEKKYPQAGQLVDQMLEHVSALQNQAQLAAKNDAPLDIQTEELENRLRRLDQEIDWADDDKLLSFVEVQRDPVKSEDSIRIAVNVPWIRFDQSARERERVQLRLREQALDRRARELSSELEVQWLELRGTAAKVASLRNRLAQMRKVEKQVKGVRDIELRTVLRDFSFELEQDLLTRGLEFYMGYLEYLGELGAFAKFSDRNLLKPEWPKL